MRIYEVVFDEKQDKGVYALSCVESPAMEDKWLTLADHPKQMQFSTVDEEKRLLLGAALIPNKKIYRHDEDGEYYITFSEKTIEQAAHAFIKNGFTNNSSENHDVKLEGVSVVQSWIVEDPEKDKSANYGKTYDKGTWVTMMRVDNDETWEKAKNGQLNGFSIDGLFSMKELNFNSNKKDAIMDKKEFVDTLKSILNLSKKDEVKDVTLAELKLKDGKTKITFEGDKPEVGVPVFLMIETEGEDMRKEPMPEGNHELESGEFLNVDANGIISEPAKEEVKEEVVEMSKEDPKEEEVDVKVELSEMLKSFKAELSKELNEAKESFKVELEKQVAEEVKKTEAVQVELEAEKAKNIELESKLEKEPAAEKIVKTELKVVQPKNAKQRLLNVAAQALNKN